MSNRQLGGKSWEDGERTRKIWSYGKGSCRGGIDPREREGLKNRRGRAPRSRVELTGNPSGKEKLNQQTEYGKRRVGYRGFVVKGNDRCPASDGRKTRKVTQE